MKTLSGAEIVERISSKIKLSFLSEKLGIPNQTISNWKIRDKPPKADELFAIADYLHVSIEWLLTGEKSSIPQEVLDLAYEINALPDVYKQIVFDTVKTLSKDASEQVKVEIQNIG